MMSNADVAFAYQDDNDFWFMSAVTIKMYL